MVVTKQKKARRQRGSRTCGWGLVHRNKGQKGGSGRAGSGKKSKCKKPMFRKEKFGKHGFVIRGVTPLSHPINMREIEDKLPRWITDGLVQEKDGMLDVQLEQLGYSKLLSEGKVTQKLRIHVSYASKAVKEKVQSAGGELILKQ